MVVKRVLIAPVPFDARGCRLLDQFAAAGVEPLMNDLGHKPTEADMIELLREADAVIVGTEPLTKKVLNAAARLRPISRIGVGPDSVDLLAARERRIEVCYTPDAPIPAVAEMTIGMILTTLRGIHISNAKMQEGQWHRVVGRRLGESVVGVLGVGGWSTGSRSDRPGGLAITRQAGTPQDLAS